MLNNSKKSITIITPDIASITMSNSHWFMLFTFIVVSVLMQSGQRHVVTVKSYELMR